MVSLRMSLVLRVTAVPSELHVMKELLVKQGSNLDAASCLLRGTLCSGFSLDLVNSKKEKTEWQCLVTAVLPSTKLFCTAGLDEFLVGVHSFLCRI